MKLTEYLRLNGPVVVMATSAGCALGVVYEAGAVGIVAKTSSGEDATAVITFGSLSLDFRYFELKKWEILAHCSLCTERVIQSSLSKCSRCLRADYCADCLRVHNCHVPADGPSREPRKEKGNVCHTARK